MSQTELLWDVAHICFRAVKHLQHLVEHYMLVLWSVWCYSNNKKQTQSWIQPAFLTGDFLQLHMWLLSHNSLMEKARSTVYANSVTLEITVSMITKLVWLFFSSFICRILVKQITVAIMYSSTPIRLKNAKNLSKGRRHRPAKSPSITTSVTRDIRTQTPYEVHDTKSCHCSDPLVRWRMNTTRGIICRPPHSWRIFSRPGVLPM